MGVVTAAPIRLLFLASAVLFYVHSLVEVFALEIVQQGPLWQWLMPAIGFGLAYAGTWMPKRPRLQEASVVVLLVVLAAYGLLYAQRSHAPVLRATQGQLLLAVYGLLVSPTFLTLVVATTLQFCVGLLIEALGIGPSVFGIDGIPTAIMGGLVIWLLGAMLEILRQDLFERLERSEEQALRDPLTGLLNRRAFVDALTLAQQHAAEEARSSTAAEAREAAGRADHLLLIDLDGFKRINDTHGHAHGDRVLLDVAKLLRGAVRQDDRVARLGGDEFLLWLRDVTPAQVDAVVERLLDGADTAALPVGLSIGIARIDDGLDEAIRRADVAMYAAKRAGGHQARRALEQAEFFSLALQA
ncbi:MAG: GGDEF domain-containing protein [Planctomycetes bacterium]|nr:GGDEF domain-containing protein [Planctomycetota bacterium]